MSTHNLLFFDFSMFVFFWIFFYFFFSSRRRPTRCLSDWSSDVCASDLPRSRGCPCPTPASGERAAAAEVARSLRGSIDWIAGHESVANGAAFGVAERLLR